MNDDTDLPAFRHVLNAAARIRPHLRLTPLLRSDELDALAGARLIFKCENLQHSGSFKFRGACNAVLALDDADARRGVVTQSSGNHGAAIAMACRLRGIAATVIVPKGAPQVKLDNIARHGATILRCAATMTARDAATAAFIAKTGATLIHPFDHPEVIAGQGTAALELDAEAPGLDAFIAPVGGGGLLSGCSLALRARHPTARIHGAEPDAARDAHDSLLIGTAITDRVPDTICDGLRGHLSARTFTLIQANTDSILLASESAIRTAMRLIYQHLKLVVEPSSAIALAAVLAERERFAGQRIGILLSGGNIDLAMLPALIDVPQTV